MSKSASQMKLQAFTSSLTLIASSYSFRCDAKYADHDVRGTIERITKAGSVRLGEFLPAPFVKGIQPTYLDQAADGSVPVVNTLSIQNMHIDTSKCRHISVDDFEELSEERKLTKGDVLLTVDGGVSIGKPALFAGEGDCTVDSHVVILRPRGLSALALVYLLASPLAQMQFKRAESGASGQTTVTEDDVRRFIFPQAMLKTIDATVQRIEAERMRIAGERKKLDDEEKSLWSKLAEIAR